MILDPLFYFRAFWQFVFTFETFLFFGSLENILSLLNSHILKPYLKLNLDDIEIIKVCRQWYVAWMARGIVSVAGVEVEWSGQEKRDLTGTTILMLTHSSSIDGMASIGFCDF